MTRVLIADDSPNAQRMGAEILSGHGIQVYGITDGAQFPQALSDFSPDLIFVDVCLPNRSGYQICEQLKTDPARRHIKVAFLVGPVDPFDPAEAVRVGADAIVQKPLEASAVRQTLHKLLAPPPPNPLEHVVAQAMKNAPVVVDADRVHAAMVLAVEAALPAFLEELTRRVVEILSKSPSKSHAG